MSRKAPWILEQPHEREGKTSMFKLDEFIELLKRPGIYRYTFASVQIWSRGREVDRSDFEHCWNG